MRHDRQRLLTALDGVTVLWPMWADIQTTEKIQELKDRLVEINERTQTILALADQEKRKRTEDEQNELNDLFAEFKEIEADIEQRETILAQSTKLRAGAGRQTTAEGPEDDEDEPTPQPQRQAASVRAQGTPQKTRQQRSAIEPVYRDKGKWGWNHMGEFVNAVRIAGIPGVSANMLDPRLTIRAAGATTYGSEGVDADGGFAVPPDFRTAIMELVMAEQSLFGRTDQLITSSNSLKVPVDETTPWQTSGGIQAYWAGEAPASGYQQSKPRVQGRTINMGKLIALVPMTDELLEDSPAMGAFILRKAPQKINFALTLSIIQGNGVDKPLGIMNSNALITVSKETGQLADTIVSENIWNMYARMSPDSLANSVWLYHHTILPQLFGMTVGIGTVPIFLPPNGLAGSPFATLMGRPMIPTQACETLGDKGDLLFVDLSQYATLTKVGGMNPKQDVSMHLWFDYGETAFRFTLRVGGMPWLSNPIPDRDGNSSTSPFIALEAR